VKPLLGLPRKSGRADDSSAATNPQEGFTMSNKKTGFIVASAVAGLFASACATVSTPAATASKDAQTAGVNCSGINSCKGSGSCAGASNSCKGQNACKGQGWTAAASEKECTDKGGKVVAAK
jgi:hypothetical protein